MKLRPLFPSLILAALLAAGFGAAAQTAPVFTLIVTPSPSPEAGTVATVSVAPSNFPLATATYAWFRDGARLDNASGIGRSSLEIATDAAKTETITIAVEVNPGAGFSSLRSSAVIKTVPNAEQLKKRLEDAQSAFALELDPESPIPNEPATAQVISFAFDRELASYRWFVDGAFQRDASGRGKWFLEFAGIAEGASRAVRVEVTTPLGITRSQNITLRPVTTALYWWANTAVPPWYKGKALPSVGSQVSLVALPNVRNREALRYRWQFNFTPDQKASGIGKSVYSFPLAFAFAESVQVLIEDAAGGFYRNEASFSISPAQSAVGIYAFRPRRGIITARQADALAATAGDALEFVAIPFFFPAGSDRSLAYTWRLGRETIPGAPPDPWHFVLRSNPGEKGENILGVEVRDTRRNGESANAAVTATFQ